MPEQEGHALLKQTQLLGVVDVQSGPHVARGGMRAFSNMGEEAVEH